MFTSSDTTILLVDDDVAVRTVIARTLGRSGHTVHEYATGEAAIDFVREHAGPIDLLLVDALLGGISGVEVAAEIRKMRPDLPALHMSGYSQDASNADASDASHFIGKPFNRDELERRVRELVGRDPVGRRRLA